MIVGIVQARTSSTRLPGKVLAPILGVPMLARQLERLQRATRLDKLVVATSTDPSDDPIEALCSEAGAACFRGSLSDVLDRYYHAAVGFEAAHVVRLTGDCPLTDPGLVDRVVEAHLEGGYDYTSNALERTFPDGLDVEVIRMACLEEAWHDARTPAQREHVTAFFYEQPERFALGSVRQERDLSALRWTVDDLVDLDFVRRVYEELDFETVGFSQEVVLELLARRPEIVRWAAGEETS